MKKLLLPLLLFSVTLTKAQSFKEKIADKKFDNLEYASASLMYEELSRSKDSKLKYHVRAGECNLNAGDYKKALLFYDKAYASTGMTDHDLYNYYQVLKYNSNYSKADEVFGKINSNEYKLIRENLKRKKLNIQELKKDSGNYTLKRLEINSEENDFCPYVINNEMYFLSSRRNTSFKGATYGWDNSYFLDIYKGTIEGNEVKNASAVKGGLQTKVHEGPLCFTKDGKTQFITRNNFVHNKLKKSKENKVNLEIFIRKKEGENWGEWTGFPFNSNEYSCGHPAVSSDGKTLYFVSDMPGTYGQTDVWVTHLDSATSTWSKPENLGQSINSEGREMFPQLFEDEVLFYSSDGKIGLGGLDIFYSVTGGDGYFEAQNIGYPLNSQKDDFGFHASSSNTGFISSNRADTKDDIFSFVSKRPIVGSSLNFIVKDKETKEIVPEANVTITDNEGKVVGQGKSDANGELKIILYAGKNYKIKTVKEGFKEGSSVINDAEIVKLSQGGDAKKEILVEKKIIGLLGIIADAETLSPIENVTITLSDSFDPKNSLVFVTDKEGDFRHIYKDKKVGDDLSYSVKLQKQGYVTKSQMVDISIKKEGYILLHDFLNIKMYKIKLGSDLGKMVDIKPIYFDLGKATIKPASIVELEKIATLLKENPMMTIELGAHTDCRGSAASNMSLSDRRAKSSAAYIVSKGIDNSRIYGKGYGESKLINGCKCEGAVKSKCSEAEHAENRRTEFKIVKLKN